MACLPLSNWMSAKFESKLQNFLWNDKNNNNKLALIKWDNLCKPKKMGGLGIKKPQWKNEALGAKIIWWLYMENSHKWAKWLEFWNFMSKCQKLISKFLTWDVGLGDKALFWEDS